jgi:hypothetical protein
MAEQARHARVKSVGMSKMRVILILRLRLDGDGLIRGYDGRFVARFVCPYISKETHGDDNEEQG